MENRKFNTGWRKTEGSGRFPHAVPESQQAESSPANDSGKKPIQNFRDLKIWQLGKEIVVEIYKITRALPSEELYGLTTQMRRASISIPCHIGEGHSRRSTRDYQRFLKIAAGSCAELETQIEVAVELGYLTASVCEKAMEKTNHETRMLRKLIGMLSESIIRHPSQQSSPVGSDIQNKERVSARQQATGSPLGI